MKKFALLLLTLMFTIFSFASPKQVNEKIYDQDVGVQQTHIVQTIMSIDSVQVMDVITSNFELSDVWIIKIDNQATDVNRYTFKKSSNKIDKEPIAIKSQVYNKRMVTLNIIYTT